MQHRCEQVAVKYSQIPRFPNATGAGAGQILRSQPDPSLSKRIQGSNTSQGALAVIYIEMPSLGLRHSCRVAGPTFWLQHDPFQDLFGSLVSLKAFLWLPLDVLGGEPSFAACCWVSLHVLD